MAKTKAKISEIEQRNLERLISWLEQKATPEQVVHILNLINRGEVGGSK